MSKNKKTDKKVKFREEKLHIFWTTWWISIKFLGKMWLMIVEKSLKSEASLSLYIFENIEVGLVKW